MRTQAMVAGAAVLSLLGTAPAHAAAPGRVDQVGFALAEPVGAGFLLVSQCGALARPDPGWVPVLTSVWCESNGAVSKTVTVPGAVATVDLENVTTTLPIIRCVHEWSVFSPTVGPPVTVTVDDCSEVPVG
jgi:hypothetical protein